MMQNFKLLSISMAAGKITSLVWREMEFAVPFRGGVLTSGWYPMAPWAGRIRDGLITSSIWC
jgi:aldose 1-epimerase